jgi:hypothetical protein
VGKSGEAQMDQGRFVSLRLDERTTLGDLVPGYMAKVIPLMESAEACLIRLAAIRRDTLCKFSLFTLTPVRVAEFRDQCLKLVSDGTVIRELAYLSFHKSAELLRAKPEFFIGVLGLASNVARTQGLVRRVEKDSKYKRFKDRYFISYRIFPLISSAPHPRTPIVIPPFSTANAEETLKVEISKKIK